MSIAAIIPAFNEEKTIAQTINALKSLRLIDEILVIDDGSTDRTAEKAAAAGASVYKLPQNRGKGTALAMGVRLTEADILCFVDADLGSSAKEFARLIPPVLNKEAEMTIAAFSPAKRRGGFGLVKSLAAYGIIKLCGYRPHSPLSGQRVLRRSVWNGLNCSARGFGVEVGLTVECLRNGYRLQEIAVQMTHRETGRDFKGFWHRGRQFFHVLRTLVELWYRQRVRMS
ncbi:MAG: glycosyltransferase family 2 protein [Firmicutes bacterium]|nr:glycosyltransferase family 2 protein [Bacillota bacterium]